MATSIYILVFGSLILNLLSCGQAVPISQSSQSIQEQEPLTCDHPDAPISCSFVNIPAILTNKMSIAANQEVGEQLMISGTIYKADGKTPYPNVVMYAYHTDSKGYYSKNGKEIGVQKWHGRLHGWCKTGKDGYYIIYTIRPGAYPDHSLPAHIHTAIKQPDGQMYWISDFVFKDDPLVNENYLKSISHLVGGTGILNVTKNKKGVWEDVRNIILTQ